MSLLNKGYKSLNCWSNIVLSWPIIFLIYSEWSLQYKCKTKGKHWISAQPLTPSSPLLKTGIIWCCVLFEMEICKSSRKKVVDFKGNWLVTSPRELLAGILVYFTNEALQELRNEKFVIISFSTKSLQYF